MNEDRFWDIVDIIDWPKLSKDRRGYEKGKALFLEEVPRLEVLEAFQDIFNEKQGELSFVLTEWENAGAEGYGWGAANPRSFCLGDDSFGDLLAHIIGMGREHYESVLADPERAHERARRNEFVESFAYCIPSSEDYDAPEVKLKRALAGLNYWTEQMANNEASWVKSELETRAKEVAELRSQVEGREVTPEEVNQLVRAAELEAQEKLEVVLLNQCHELEMELKDAQKRHKAVRNRIRDLSSK